MLACKACLLSFVCFTHLAAGVIYRRVRITLISFSLSFLGLHAMIRWHSKISLPGDPSETLLPQDFHFFVSQDQSYISFLLTSSNYWWVFSQVRPIEIVEMMHLIFYSGIIGWLLRNCVRKTWIFCMHYASSPLYESLGMWYFVCISKQIFVQLSHKRKNRYVYTYAGLTTGLAEWLLGILPLGDWLVWISILAVDMEIGIWGCFLGYSPTIQSSLVPSISQGIGIGQNLVTEENWALTPWPASQTLWMASQTPYLAFSTPWWASHSFWVAFHMYHLTIRPPDCISSNFV